MTTPNERRAGMERDKVIGVRVCPDERKALEAIAKQDRRNISEMLRELVRQEAERRGLWPPKGYGP